MVDISPYQLVIAGFLNHQHMEAWKLCSLDDGTKVQGDISTHQTAFAGCNKHQPSFEKGF